MELTNEFIAAVKGAGKTRVFVDSEWCGLRLKVSARGAKSFQQLMTVNGSVTTRGLGGWPKVSLCAARKQAVTNDLLNRIRNEGGFPDLSDPVEMTLAECVDRTIEAKRDGWKKPKAMEAQWRSSMRHATLLLERPVAGISAADALGLLEPMLKRTPALTKALRSRLSEAVDRAIVLGLRTDNPFEVVRKLLRNGGNGKARHFDALPWKEVPAVFEALLTEGTARTLALGWQIANAARPGEAVGARLREIEGDLWTIPAERMKASREHRVPLSPAALRVLELAKAKGFNRNGFVFANRFGAASGYRTASEVCKQMNLGCSAHGFRSSFRDWCADHGKERELAEAALAHTVGGVEGSYFRSDLFDRRRELMAEWGSFLAG